MSDPGDLAMASRIREALKMVIDPELGHNVVDLGMIYAIEVSGACAAAITMTTTTRGCPATEYLKHAVSDCAWAVPGIEFADVALVYDPPWTPEMMSDEIAPLFRR